MAVALLLHKSDQAVCMYYIRFLGNSAKLISNKPFTRSRFGHQQS